VITDPDYPELDNAIEFTVSELSGALKRTLEDAYGYVRVRGEISGFKRAASGHFYFALKDASACLDAVCWRLTAQRLTFKPEDGLEVVASGRITTYPSRSKYQLMVDRLAPAGVGALMALLEERRKQLAAEGLFAAERKRPIPFLPEVIGVVTSPTGAVIRDILHRLAERFPRRVLLWPVLVQGELAAEQVAAAIEGFNHLAPGGAVPRPDVLIVARGGGSLEDLWAFNEERVVRAAAASAIPLISAIGHETDTTLIDHAADQRAPTPTAAAELAVPVRAELGQRLGQLDQRLFHGAERELRQLGQRVSGLARGLPDPIALLGQATQRLDDLAERLPHGLRARSERAARDLWGLGARLGPPTQALLRQRRIGLNGLIGRLTLEEIGNRLPRHARGLAELDTRQGHAVARRLADAQARLQAQASLLASLSYRGVLERGFALVRDERGQLVDGAARARSQTTLEIEFHDGRVPTVVARGPRSARPAAPAAKQGRLL
jgi:exodeoxyribonuclease VII large subunit